MFESNYYDAFFVDVDVTVVVDVVVAIKDENDGDEVKFVVG